MAITSKLKINNRSYSIFECDYSIRQAVDATCRPSDRPRGGLIHLTLAAPDDNDMFFHEWVCNKDIIHDGELEISVNSGGDISTRHVGFKDAYCVGLREYFRSDDNNIVTMTIDIAAGIISFGDSLEFTS